MSLEARPQVGGADGAHVVRQEGEPFEALWRRFKRRRARAGIDAELRRRRAASSPGQRRRAKRARAAYLRKRAAAKATGAS